MVTGEAQAHRTGADWSASWMRPRISLYSVSCSPSVSASAARVYSFSACAQAGRGRAQAG